MQQSDKTENNRHCFKINKDFFPLFITENIQLSFATYSNFDEKSILFRGGGGGGITKLDNRKFCGVGCMTSTPGMEIIGVWVV